MKPTLAVRRARAIFGERGLREVRDRVEDGRTAAEQLLPPPRTYVRAISVAGARPLGLGGTERTRGVPTALTPAATGTAVGEAEIAIGFSAPERVEQVSLLREGAMAAKKLLDGRENELTPDEALGLEAIIHVEGRPALFIENGVFRAPPPAWEILNKHRKAIEATFDRVGRIELIGHPNYEWVGTGFLVAPNVLMTNRHVALTFTNRKKSGAWRFTPGIKRFIDFKEELAIPVEDEYEISGLIGIHEKLDMALLRVTWGKTKRPDPLPISSRAPQSVKGRKVYVVGYPARDDRNGLEAMRNIFADVFNVKRLQPGELIELKKPYTFHDCSTLGGNSGSAVFDLESQEVLALHFGGRFQERNYAIPLWTLRRDALLKKAKVNFA